MPKKKKTRPMTQMKMSIYQDAEEAVSRETKPKKPKFFLVSQEHLGTLIVVVRHFLADPSILTENKTNAQKAESQLLEVLESKPVSRETRKVGSRGTSKKQRKPRSA